MLKPMKTLIVAASFALLASSAFAASYSGSCSKPNSFTVSSKNIGSCQDGDYHFTCVHKEGKGSCIQNDTELTVYTGSMGNVTPPQNEN